MNNTSIKHENKSKSPTTTCTVLEDYVSFTVSDKRPITIEGLKLFMEDSIKEIQKNKEIVTITMFLIKKGIARQTYYDWVEKYDFMKQYHDILLTIIADRNVAKMKDDFRYLNFVQPYYDSEVYGKAAKFWNDVKKDEPQQPTKINVVFACTDCGKIPK